MDDDLEVEAMDDDEARDAFRLLEAATGADRDESIVKGMRSRAERVYESRREAEEEGGRRWVGRRVSSVSLLLPLQGDAHSPSVGGGVEEDATEVVSSRKLISGRKKAKIGRRRRVEVGRKREGRELAERP